MWLLVCEQENGESVSYYLLKDREYSIGRKECDLALPSHPYISPKHAVLKVKRKKQSEYATGSRYSFLLVDISTSGTFVNDKKLLKSEKTLEEGDRIVFGNPRDRLTYYLRWEPPVICFPTFRESLSSHKQSLANTGICVLERWEGRVTHLAISDIRIKREVLLALSKRVPIVSLKWVEKLVDAVTNFKPIPSTESHLPVLAESCKVDNPALFLLDKRRAKLFEGKHFYFLHNDEYQFYLLPISHCSGLCTLVDISDSTFATFDRYVKPDSVVISGNTSALSGDPGADEFIANLQDCLVQAGRSMVSDNRIINAIVYISNIDLFRGTFSNPESALPGPTTNSPSNSVGSSVSPETASPLALAHIKTEPDSKNDLFSLFDEEPSDQFEDTAISQRNSVLQLPTTAKLRSLIECGDAYRNPLCDWEMECEGRKVPTVKTTPFSSQQDQVSEAMVASPIDTLPDSDGWIRCRRSQKSPEYTTNTLSAFSPHPTQAEKENRIVKKKCFVKNYWPGMGKILTQQQTYPHRVVTSIEPIKSSSSDEAELLDIDVYYTQNKKRTPKKLQQGHYQSQGRISSPSTPKNKRTSMLKSPRSCKRSLLASSAQSETDSDNEDYLRLLPTVPKY